MGQPINLRSSVWYRSAFHIDKSEVIKKFLLAEEKASLISVPGGFFKTANMLMTAAFVCAKDTPELAADQRKQFEKLKIMRHGDLVERYCTQHPIMVICFDQKRHLSGAEAISEALASGFRENLFLLDSPRLSDSQKSVFRVYLNAGEGKARLHERGTFTHALGFLCDMLHAHYEKKVYAFVDDYDYPMLECVVHRAPLADLESFLMDLLANLLRCEGLARAMFTGWTSLARARGLDVRAYRFLHDHEFSKYYGLLWKDVQRRTELNLRQVTTYFQPYRTLANVLIFSPEWVTAYPYAVRGRCLRKLFDKKAMRVPLVTEAFRTLFRNEAIEYEIPSLTPHMDVLQLNRLFNETADQVDPVDFVLMFALLLELGVFNFTKGFVRCVRLNGCMWTQIRNMKLRINRMNWAYKYLQILYGAESIL